MDLLESRRGEAGDVALLASVWEAREPEAWSDDLFPLVFYSSCYCGVFLLLLSFCLRSVAAACAEPIDSLRCLI